MRVNQEELIKFNAYTACRLGIGGAVLLGQLEQLENESKENNIIYISEGQKYNLRLSYTCIAKVLPYLSEDVIAILVEMLVREGLVTEGSLESDLNFSYYSITELGKRLLRITEKIDCLCYLKRLN